MTVHPDLDWRPVRHDAQLVPNVVNMVMVTRIDPYLRRDPACSSRLAVDSFGCGFSRMVRSNLHPRAMHPAGSAGGRLGGRPGRKGPAFGSGPHFGIRDRIEEVSTSHPKSSNSCSEHRKEFILALLSTVRPAMTPRWDEPYRPAPWHELHCVS